MFLIDGKGCFLLNGLDDVDFSGVAGNFEQLFALCFSVINDPSKKDFSLSSSQRK